MPAVSVRFADITGNGRADYLCIAPNGKVMGNLHEDDDSFSDMMQIKFADTMDRANLRWEDVDGDGKADMIWINKFNGDGHVWCVSLSTHQLLASLPHAAWFIRKSSVWSEL